MNNQKILFVTCVNDEALYRRCLKHITNLIIPKDFSVEFLAIRGAKSITQAYNSALSNDAKYKIYLHQDTFILNRHFLLNMLELFQSNPQLGLLGMVGCKKLPPNGTWWDGKDLVGKVIAYPEQTFTVLRFKEIDTPFEEVEAVDGLIMATQYDIPWREELDGFHFYDASQSVEFTRRGYLVGVPRQVEPWCLHYHRYTRFFDPEYFRLQYIFLKSCWGKL
ncbi:glycosyltransferase family protein [Lihuaxuella thermophila]|uniref:Glycosyltransferase like family protein n=1 Tax=Lihuaxuella thermophila TaxID=1173111 RepID=A0A1H8JDG3_9BACL|nr:glycosyltransferase family protein [Lihuaxuella thermophila]SEN78844.1 Glycosyltransferase like family protein [Lihuaxuella thermophila]